MKINQKSTYEKFSPGRRNDKNQVRKSILISGSWDTVTVVRSISFVGGIEKRDKSTGDKVLYSKCSYSDCIVNNSFYS